MLTMVEGKPSVLIVGGLGHMGRFLALYIQKEGLASEVRLVDKQLPELAYLGPEFAEACAKEKFVQADASREQFLSKIFDRADERPFDFVFNCAGETKYSQEDEVYKARSYGLSMNVGREAAKRKVPCFVECSTGIVYKADSTPSKETDKLKPWTKFAKWKLQAEEDLAKIEGLNLTILRFAHIYGPYTSKFLGTVLCISRLYQDLGKELKFLWNRDLRNNTVHVEDAARALWTAATWYVKEKPPQHPVFNIVDHGNTSQGSVSDLVHEYFGIATSFQGFLASQFAKLQLDSVVDDINDDLLDPWAEMLEEAGITQRGPISPFMEKELLRDDDLSMDGGKFEKTTGFTYNRPQIGMREIEEIVESYKKMKWWP